MIRHAPMARLDAALPPNFRGLLLAGSFNLWRLRATATIAGSDAGVFANFSASGSRGAFGLRCA